MSAVLALRQPRGVSPAEVEVLAPNVLSVRHWDRLLGGALYAATPRLPWAQLLRRTFAVDVLACLTCGGQLRVLGAVLLTLARSRTASPGVLTVRVDT